VSPLPVLLALGLSVPALAGEAFERAKAEQETFARCLRAAENPAPPERPAAPSTACRSGCTMESVLADHGLKSRLSSEVVLRQVCRAVALRAPEPCEVLDDVEGRPETGGRMCRRLYEMALLSRALAGGVADTARCEAWCAMAPAPPPGELVGKVCASILKGDYLRACADIEKWKTSPDRGYNVRECHWEMQALLGAGDAEFCDRHYRPGSDVCRAAGLYKKGDCGGDPLCRAMRKEGLAACAPLDAGILEQARAFSAESAGAVSADPNAAQEAVRLAEGCARARARTLRALGEAKSAELDGRQKNLEETFQLRRGISSSHSVAPFASYAGGWTFSLGKLAAPVTVDENGRFLAFAGEFTLAGVIDPATGELSGMSAGPGGREGRITGRCASFSECAGNDSLSARFRLKR